MDIKKIAIIGSNGFIGSNLAKKLKTISDTKIYLFGRSETSTLGNDFLYTQINISDTQQVLHHFRDIDFIYFLASETIPATSWDKPTIEITNNLLPFVTFIETISTLNIKRVVFVSSAGTIYGPTDLKVDEDSVKKPFSPYGITKLAMEYYLNYFHHKHGLLYDVYRVSNVYGEGQNISKGLGIINTFLEKILIDHKIQIFGDGSNVRNYIYIQDLVTLMCYSINSGLETSNIFNASSNDTLSINQLVAIIKKVVDQEFAVEYMPTRSSDNSTIFLDNSRLLNKNPDFKFTDIQEGIRSTYELIKSRMHFK